MMQFYTNNGLFENLPPLVASNYVTLTPVRAIAAADQHNVDLTPAEIAAGIVRFINTGSCDLTGIIPPAQAEGYRLKIMNMGTNDFKPKNNDSASLVANRFDMVNSVSLKNGQWIEVMYVDGRWRRQIDK